MGRSDCKYNGYAIARVLDTNGRTGSAFLIDSYVGPSVPSRAVAKQLG
jgi:hypothetical protein